MSAQSTIHRLEYTDYTDYDAHVYTHAYAHVKIHTRLYIHVHMGLYTSPCTCLHACLHACLYACISTYTCTNRCICSYTYLYTHLHTPHSAETWARQVVVKNASDLNTWPPNISIHMTINMAILYMPINMSMQLCACQHSPRSAGQQFRLQKIV